MKKRFLTLLLASSLASVMFAQTTTPPARTPPTAAEIVAHKVAFLTSLLTLNSSQQTQATSIYTASITADQTAQASLATAQSTLKDAIKADNVNLITSTATTIGNLQAQIIASDAKADAAFYALLTADQKAKLDNSHGFGPGGPGRPGGPGGPGHHLYGPGPAGFGGPGGRF